MNLTDNIFFKNFKKTSNSKKLKKILLSLLNQENQIINSLRKSYKDSWKKVDIKKYKKFSNINLIGMGGSIMGSKSIYSFLKKKIKKNFFFIDNFEHNEINNLNKKNRLNLIISKSGNTLETIVNSNILMNPKSKNIFITENKDNYLRHLANKMKSEVIDHNNYIGGRYSVLSEVGMLPAHLMGLNVEKFRNLNQLIKNKYFLEGLIKNVKNIIDLSKKKKIKFNNIKL